MTNQANQEFKKIMRNNNRIMRKRFEIFKLNFENFTIYCKLIGRFTYKCRFLIITMLLLVATILIVLPTTWWVLMNSIVRYESSLPMWKHILAIVIAAADMGYVYIRYYAMKTRHQHR